MVYFITVTPFSITEWRNRGHKISYQAAAFTSCIFTLSGFFNVILYFKTRPGLFKGNEEVQPWLGDVKSVPHGNDILERSGRGRENAHATPSHMLSARGGMEKEVVEGLHLDANGSTSRRRSSLEYLNLPPGRRDASGSLARDLEKDISDGGDEEEDLGRLPP